MDSPLALGYMGQSSNTENTEIIAQNTREEKKACFYICSPFIAMFGMFQKDFWRLSISLIFP